MIYQNNNACYIEYYPYRINMTSAPEICDNYFCGNRINAIDILCESKSKESESMRFNNFEIIKLNDNRYELVKWNGNSNFTIAFITYDDKENDWNFESVGMRFIEYYEGGLCDYIKHYMALIDVIKRYSTD